MRTTALAAATADLPRPWSRRTTSSCVRATRFRVSPHVTITPQRHSLRVSAAQSEPSTDGEADIETDTAAFNLRRRGPAGLVLDGTRTDRLAFVPDATLDEAYARGLTTDPTAGPAARPYTRLRSLRLRASCGPATEQLLRSSLLPSLERLTLYSHYEGEEPGPQTEAPPGPAAREEGGRAAAMGTPPDFLAFTGLRELNIDESGTRYGSGRPWSEWAAFRHLRALESLTWIGDYKCGLRGDVRDALPALSGLRRLSLHSAYHCPRGLGQLQQLESLSATIKTDGGDSLGAWDLRGLRGLREAVFQGRGFGGLAALPRMDASLTALERLCLVDAQVPLRIAEPGRALTAGDVGEGPPSPQAPKQEQAVVVAGTTTAATLAAVAAEVQLDPVCDVFAAWVAPCSGVLPSLRAVEVWYPLFTQGGVDFSGRLQLNPRSDSDGGFQAEDGARWRARVWRYQGEGGYGEVTEPLVVRTLSGIPVAELELEGDTTRRLWIKLAFERV